MSNTDVTTVHEQLYCRFKKVTNSVHSTNSKKKLVIELSKWRMRYTVTGFYRGTASISKTPATKLLLASIKHGKQSSVKNSGSDNVK